MLGKPCVFCLSCLSQQKRRSLTPPKFNIAPEKGWLEDDPFLLGWPIFRGELFVFGSLLKFY